MDTLDVGKLILVVIAAISLLRVINTYLKGFEEICNRNSIEAPEEIQAYMVSVCGGELTFQLMNNSSRNIIVQLLVNQISPQKTDQSQHVYAVEAGQILFCTAIMHDCPAREYLKLKLEYV